MSSDRARAEEAPTAGQYFCNEPWIGVLSIEVNQDVTFCPCYLKLRLGNLDTQSLEALWNASALVAIRSAFGAGELPEACRGQLCAPALGRANYLTEIPSPDA
jgi:hypothetical protein